MQTSLDRGVSGRQARDCDGKEIREYPKSDASKRSVPVDEYTAEVLRQWIELKSNLMKELGFKPSMSMLVCGPEMIPQTYQS